jgi:hypothetical protein
MKRTKLSLLVLAVASFFVSPSFGQMSKATALLKGDATSSSGSANDVSITIYKGAEMFSKTKLTSEGKFTAVLQPGNQYRLTFTGAKYYFHEEQLSIPASDKFQEVPMHVMLKELELGRPFTFSDLIFEPKSSSISQNVMADMENIAGAMKRNSQLSISATVYPDQDASGKNASAQSVLTDSRKSAIQAFFLSKNIPASNVTVMVSSTAPTGGSFERVVTNDPPPAKGKKPKKKSGKAPAAGVSGKKVMVPQYADITMKMN